MVSRDHFLQDYDSGHRYGIIGEPEVRLRGIRWHRWENLHSVLFYLSNKNQSKLQRSNVATKPFDFFYSGAADAKRNELAALSLSCSQGPCHCFPARSSGQRYRQLHWIPMPSVSYFNREDQFLEGDLLSAVMKRHFYADLFNSMGLGATLRHFGTQVKASSRG